MFKLKKSFYVMQPIFSNNCIYGYEILSRLLSKNELITPDTYISSLSEEDHYSFTIKNIINLCRIHKDFKNNEKIFYFLNIDECLFNDFFIKDLITVLNFYEINKENIVFEILENKSIKNKELFIKSINIAKNNGIKIALDDFGSEFSNIDRLLKINPDYIKIDRLFISGIEKNIKKQFILNNLFKMIKDLDIMIISEGIETLLEYEYIKSLKSDLYQGYYLSKPETVKNTKEIRCIA